MELEIPVKIENKEVEPIPVRIVDETEAEPIRAADFASYQSWTINADNAKTTPPIRLLAQDTRRRRAVISLWCGAVPAGSEELVAGWIGSMAQVQNNGGFFVTAFGDRFTVENQRELWFAPNGDFWAIAGTGTMFIRVVDERYSNVAPTP